MEIHVSLSYWIYRATCSYSEPKQFSIHSTETKHTVPNQNNSVHTVPKQNNSVHSTEQLGFQEIWYLKIFRKYVEYVQISLQYDNNSSTLLHMQTDGCLWQYLAQLLSKWKIIQTNLAGTITTHIWLPVNPPPRKSYRLWDTNTIQQRGHRWQYNTAHALCMTHN